MLAQVPPMLGEPKAMIHKLAILLCAKCKKPTHVTVYQEYIKVSMDKYLFVFLHSAPGTRKAGSRIEIHAKAQENRLTI
jgi:hypothetical protein